MTAALLRSAAADRGVNCFMGSAWSGFVVSMWTGLFFSVRFEWSRSEKKLSVLKRKLKKIGAYGSDDGLAVGLRGGTRKAPDGSRD